MLICLVWPLLLLHMLLWWHQTTTDNSILGDGSKPSRLSSIVCTAFMVSPKPLGRADMRMSFHVPWGRHATAAMATRLGCSDKNSVPENASSLSLEDLQAQLSYIEALEERNKAQLDSFVDEQDQWNSLEPFEQELLRSKQSILEQMESLGSSA
jgi:hypothetical protein